MCHVFLRLSSRKVTKLHSSLPYMCQRKFAIRKSSKHFSKRSTNKKHLPTICRTVAVFPCWQVIPWNDFGGFGPLQENKAVMKSFTRCQRTARTAWPGRMISSNWWWNTTNNEWMTKWCRFLLCFFWDWGKLLFLQHFPGWLILMFKNAQTSWTTTTNVWIPYLWLKKRLGNLAMQNHQGTWQALANWWPRCWAWKAQWTCEV